jgi:hypothetical protein
MRKFKFILIVSLCAIFLGSSPAYFGLKKLLSDLDGNGKTISNADFLVDNTDFGTNPTVVSWFIASITSASGAGTEHGWQDNFETPSIRSTVESDGAGGVQEPRLYIYGQLIVSSESVTASGDAATLDPTVISTYLTTESAGGADVAGLADGEKAGQRKTIYLVVDGGDDAEITPTTFTGGTKITLDTAGESVTLEWSGAAWFVQSTNGGVIS